MANWSDPRPNAAPFTGASAPRSVAYDAGLRSYMLTVYNYMASGVLLTGIVALLFAKTGAVAALFNPVTGAPNALGWIVTFAPLGFVFGMSFGGRRMSTPALKAMFWGFSAVMGLSLSTIFLVYTGTTIAQAFFATAAGFAGLSLYGYTTQRNLSALGTFMMVGVIGLIVAMLINMFVQSSALSMVISAVGVFVFAGLAAYDTQRTKANYAYVAGTPMQDRAMVMSALSLYLDFINMFLFVLQLFGGNRR